MLNDQAEVIKYKWTSEWEEEEQANPFMDQ